MEQMEILEKIDTLIGEFVWGCSNELQEMYYSGGHGLIFLAPAWIVFLIEKHGNMLSMEKEVLIRGIRVIPNHEDSLVLYHPNYGLYKDERFIRKMTLVGGYNPTDSKLVVTMKSLVEIAIPDNPLLGSLN